jgi:hypothetical protein
VDLSIGAGKVVALRALRLGQDDLLNCIGRLDGPPQARCGSGRT